MKKRTNLNYVNIVLSTDQLNEARKQLNRLYGFDDGFGADNDCPVELEKAHYVLNRNHILKGSLKVNRDGTLSFRPSPHAKG